MSKSDRMDYAIQKAVELGVTEITPLTSERCELRLRGEERAEKKIEHWQRVAISACEQCGRNRVPLIHAPMALNDWLPTVNTELKLVLAPAHRGALPTNPITSVSLLIGPEGGLSELEIQLAKQHHFQAWQIGPRSTHRNCACRRAGAVAGEMGRLLKNRKYLMVLYLPSALL